MRNITIVSIIILVLFCYPSFAQIKGIDQYENQIHTARNFMIEQKYNEAIKEYELGISAIDKHNTSTPFFEAAACALQIKNEDLAAHYIREGIRKGGAPLFYLNAYEGFTQVFKQTGLWKEIIKSYPQLRKEYFAFYVADMDLYLLLEQMIVEDQLIRTMSNTETVVNDEKLSAFFASEMLRIDDKNIQKLMKITRDHGWQHEAWILLWHQRGTYKEKNEVWEFFIPLIDKEIAEGTIEKSFWCIFEDSKALRENNHTLYGMLPGKVDNRVNERRKLVNLPPLSQQEIDQVNKDEITFF